MFKQSIRGKVDHTLAKKVLPIFVIAGLLAFPAVFKGQTLVSSKVGSDHQPNTGARAQGWAKYDIGMKYRLITGTAWSYKYCSGYVVWNHAQVMPKSAFPALGIDSWATLQTQGGTLLTFRYKTVLAATGLPMNKWLTQTPVPRVAQKATILWSLPHFSHQLQKQNVRLLVCFGVQLTESVSHSQATRPSVPLMTVRGILLPPPARILALPPHQHRETAVEGEEVKSPASAACGRLTASSAATLPF
jgi:hypothetical protein